MLARDADIDAKIAEQERTVEAVRQASEIQMRTGVTEFSLPSLPGSFETLLSKTLDNIGEDTERQIADHLTAHGMRDTGGTWVAQGIEHLEGDSCPFCGQDIRALPLVADYKAFFGREYKKLKADIEALQRTIAQQFGEGAAGRLATLAMQNAAAAEFWKRYCSFDPARIVPPPSLEDALKNLGQEALRLLTRKSNAPLESIVQDEVFANASAAYEAIQQAVGETNSAIREVAASITAKKAATSAADLKTVEAELASLKASKKRHDPTVSQSCLDYLGRLLQKAKIDEAKETVRTKLEEHTKKVVKPYETRINEYLDTFNADFKIGETRHTYPGGIATSSYRIIINSTAVDLGDANTPQDRPSFKNTLSAGDRTTLALAFFLAHLERDPDKGKKVVVLDDPFTSHDAFRRRQTVHEIRKIGRDCAQVILLCTTSHSSSRFGKKPRHPSA